MFLTGPHRVIPVKLVTYFCEKILLCHEALSVRPRCMESGATSAYGGL